MGPILPFVIGTLGVLFWLRVCKILTPWIGQNRLADRIGAHTYAIMTHHLTGALLFKFALAAIATGLGLSLPNLDVQRIHTDFWSSTPAATCRSSTCSSASPSRSPFNKPSLACATAAPPCCQQPCGQQVTAGRGKTARGYRDVICTKYKAAFKALYLNNSML